MSCYVPNNEFYLPRPNLFYCCSGNFVKNFAIGAAYGAGVSLFFSNPVPRMIKLSIGWGTVFSLCFTRGLYNTPGFLKRTDAFKPILDRDCDWMSVAQIEKYKHTVQDIIDEQI